MNKGYLSIDQTIGNIAIIFFLLLGMLNANPGTVQAEEEVSTKPVITQGDSIQVLMDKNGSPQAFELILSVENAEEDDTFSWSITSSPAHRSASVGADGQESAVTYLPETDYVGDDQFTVNVINQLNETDEILVKVSVLETELTQTPEPEITPTSEPTVEPLVENSNPDFAGYITLDFVAEQLLAYGWPASTPVTLTVDNPSTVTTEDYTETVDMNTDSTPVATFTWPTIEIETGATLTVSGDGDSVQLVNSLVVLNMDTFHNTILGSGPVGANLIVSLYDGLRFDRNLIVDENGTWIADFHIPGDYPYGYHNANLAYVLSGWVQSTLSNGSSIKVGLDAAPMFIQASMTGNFLASSQWPANSSLSLTIDDLTTGVGTDYSEQLIANSQGSADFELSDFLLEPSQLIIVTDGISTKSMIISNLTIDQVNTESDLVCGTADAESEVMAFITSGMNPFFWYTTADQNGNWCFDFSSTTDDVDIKPGFQITIKQADEDGDFTSVGFALPNPKGKVIVTDNEIYTYDWGAGAIVSLAIDDPANGEGIDYIETQPVIEDAHHNTDLRFYLHDFELAAGQFITLTDGQIIKTILVSEITITDIYIDLNRIYGTGPIDSTIRVAVGDEESLTSFNVPVNSTGTWSLDTRPSDSLLKRTLKPGLLVNMSFADEDGDWIEYSQTIPQPRFAADFDSNTVIGWDWPLGATVSVTIDDPVDGTDIDFSATTTIIGHNYNPHFVLDLGAFQLAPGQIITVTDGVTSKNHIVSSLNLTDIDPDTDVVTGSSDTSGTLKSWICDRKGCIYKRTTQIIDGSWTVDFAHTGEEYWQIDKFDIVPGTQIFFQQADDDADFTLLSGMLISFTDVPPDYSETLGGTTYNLFPYIQALSNAGLTAGTTTNPPAYSPALTLDRSMAAVFMLRGNFGTAYSPPDAPWNTFTNESWVNNAYAQKWAEGLFQAHLTAGCQTSPLMYCPDRTLTREEAVVFALHLKYDTIGGDGNVVSYTPLAASGTVFADMTDPSYWATKWAEQAYLDGILPACGTTNGKPHFCPNDPVNRAWAAYMIVKAKNLTLP